MDDKYNHNIEKHIKESFDSYESLESDTSAYMISIKEALKRNLAIPKELLIPSHYLNAMRELYNYERRYNDVIVLADRILLNEFYLDNRIVKEIRYWLCLALCRKRDERLLKEAMKIDGADHNFLLGFYYRLKGRNDEAISRFNQVLNDNPNFYRAKRELVQVYLNTERYSGALQLAKDNYLLDKNNPFNSQSYYRCLIKTDGLKYKNELNKLLLELEKSPHEKANEMFLTAKAQYLCFIENDKINSLNCAEDALNTFPSIIYPYLTKLEILKKFEMYDELEKLLKLINNKFEKENEIYGKLAYLSSHVIVLAEKGDKEIALRYCIDKIKNKFSKTIYDNMLLEIERV